ncbi:MAG: type II secretion system F family protein [Methanomicrobia archaeon]|nr:type II secretion system F family protein [Methanomicrobia archaeon]
MVEQVRKKGALTSYGKFAHRLLHNFVQPILKYFEDLSPYLRKADLTINIGAYVSATILSSIIVFVVYFCCFVFLYPVISTFSIFQNVSYVMLTVITSLLAMLGTFFGFWLYPSFKTSERKRKIENGLPAAVDTMATIASTGVPPAVIFWSLVEYRRHGEISREAEKLLNDIELFGLDLVSALQRAALRSPSPSLSEMFWKMIATIRTGGDLREYLYIEGTKLRERERRKIEASIDSLGMVAEIYVTALILAPVFIIIMTSIMGLMGTDVATLLMVQQVVIYIGLPVGYAVILIMIDQVQPKV